MKFDIDNDALQQVEEIKHRVEENSKTIDEIVDTFKNIFPNISYQQILHTLDINSFDINNTYLQLQYPFKYNLSFNKIDDYIITHMSNDHTLYKSLVSLKGEQSLLRRKRYLNQRMTFFN